MLGRRHGPCPPPPPRSSVRTDGHRVSFVRGLAPSLTSAAPVVVRHRVRHPAAPQMKVVVVSDLHAGGWWTTRAMLERMVDLANREAADLAIFAGDAIADRNLSYQALPAAEAIAPLVRLQAPLGVWSVLGNHDWSDDVLARQSGFATCSVLEALRAARLPVLGNEAVDLGPVWLVGIDSRQARKPMRQPGFDRIDSAYAQVPAGAPSILLAHEPDIFAEDRRALLQISGHTHGGQIAPLGWTPKVPSKHGSRYAWGHVVEEGRHLIVSGGVGFSGVPLRIGRPPEVTVIELERGEIQAA